MRVAGKHSKNGKLANACFTLKTKSQFIPMDRLEYKGAQLCSVLCNVFIQIGGLEMYELQLRLIESRKSSKTHETEFERTNTALEEERHRNAALEKTVEVIKQRQKHLDRIELLEMFREWLVSLCFFWVSYR